VCIEQQNNNNKAKQIPSMLVIYQQATQVAAWLGKSSKHLYVLLITENEAYGSGARSITFAAPQNSAEAVCAVISEVYNHSYSSHIWV